MTNNEPNIGSQRYRISIRLVNDDSDVSRLSHQESDNMDKLRFMVLF